MPASNRNPFINLGTSNPEPNRRQRQEVARYIGRHHRNRSAPNRRTHPAPSGDVHGALTHRPAIDSEGERSSRGPSSNRFADRAGQLSTTREWETTDPTDLQIAWVRTGQPPLLRPVVEAWMPAYPDSHRDKVLDVLDFRESYLMISAPVCTATPSPFVAHVW